MSKLEHKKRHKFLHENLDELIADYIAVTKRKPSETNLLDFLLWSAEQTKYPTEGIKHG